MTFKKNLYIGTAGWNIPSSFKSLFPQGKSILESYSKQFNAVEINSSFYRSHKKSTYERWEATAPENFLFSVKMPKEITHQQRLLDVESQISQFIFEITGLKDKLGPLLIQLPPSLQFDLEMVQPFFNLLRKKYKGKVVIEPRHLSWVETEAQALLSNYQIALVNADPNVLLLKNDLKSDFRYYRLHGVPIFMHPLMITLFSKSSPRHYMMPIGSSLIILNLEHPSITP